MVSATPKYCDETKFESQAPLPINFMSRTDVQKQQ